MDSTEKILMAGFKSFGGSTVNPSISACKRLKGEKVNGFEIIVGEIPLRFH